jgi:hypothetical protein
MTTMAQKVSCIFYCEFDNEAGPVLYCQTPTKFFTGDQFDSISQYLITKPQFCGKLITVTAYGRKIMGFPVCIEDPKYGRNALIFNIGLVLEVAKHGDDDAGMFGPLVRKLAGTLQTLECENGALFDPQKKSKLPDILQKVRSELNEYGQCAVPVDGVNTIHLRLGGANRTAIAVRDHQVPVPMVELARSMEPTSDLTLRHIVQWIDGIRFIKRIAHEADVELALVKSCVQHLLKCNLVKMIDIFQFSNCYATTPLMPRLATEVALQEECWAFIGPKGTDFASFHHVLKIFTAFQAGVTVRGLCVDHGEIIERLGLDIRRIVTFGAMHGFLRRVHVLPVRLQPIAMTTHEHIGSTGASDDDFDHNLGPSRWSRAVNGDRTYDELCTAFCRSGCTFEALDKVLKDDCITLHI